MSGWLQNTYMTIIDGLYKISVVLRRTSTPSTPSTVPKHIFAHNSSPWAPTAMKPVPFEAPDLVLAHGSGPKALGAHLDMFIRVQKSKDDQV